MMLSMRDLFFVFLSFLSTLRADDFFCHTESLQRAHIGVCVVDLESGKEIYSSHPDQFFRVASCQKVVLSMVAISLLGEQFRYKTDLEYEGKIDERGILKGNVWIRGGGDPLLSLDILDQWAAAVKKEGICKVVGKIYVDTSFFETALASPYWLFEDLGNYYGAGASALTIHQNYYKITFQPGLKEGDPAKILSKKPEIPGLIVRNEVTTGPLGSGDRVWIFGSEYSPLQFYRGTVPLGVEVMTIRAAIPDPAYFCGASLAEKIEVTKGVEVVREGEILPKKFLHRHYSPYLKEIIKEMNTYSINLYAEHLLKTLGEGKASEGVKKVEQFLKERNIAGHARDGSGLAQNNFLTPRGFIRLLCEMKENPIYFPVLNSLTAPGKSGSLLFFPKLEGAVLKAKTGSMSTVYNLVGYLQLEDGRELAVVILCNNYEGSTKEIRAEMHRFLQALSISREI